MSRTALSALHAQNESRINDASVVRRARAVVPRGSRLNRLYLYPTTSFFLDFIGKLLLRRIFGQKNYLRVGTRQSVEVYRTDAGLCTPPLL